MKIARLENMIKGWFIGSFEPTLCHTGAVEVGVKTYQAGESEAAHYHKIATEFTVITQGEVEMNGVRYRTGDIIVIEPGDVTDFSAITDVTTTVVKIPGATNDKYPAQ
jgi:quercetin dioxygenase-like cupin family protein